MAQTQPLLNAPTISAEMQHINDAVKNHVTMKTSGGAFGDRRLG